MKSPTFTTQEEIVLKPQTHFICLKMKVVLRPTLNGHLKVKEMMHEAALTWDLKHSSDEC